MFKVIISYSSNTDKPQLEKFVLRSKFRGVVLSPIPDFWCNLKKDSGLKNKKTIKEIYHD